MQSSRGNSDGGAGELNLRNTASNHCSHGAMAGRRRVSKTALRLLFFQMILFSSAYNFPTVLPAQAKPSREYELKAAFLFNFAKFVEWPSNAFANPEAPFLVCVLGPDPFGSVLDDALRGKAIAEHSVNVIRVQHVADISGCQILFVAASESHLLPEILAKLHGQCVLVIGETNDFASLGGVIQFTLEENRVRFFINTDAADRAGLKISSKLLALAKIVRDASATGKS
jgi:YfiR/HmsC-like